MTELFEPTIIGYSCILPGANSPSEVWSVLSGGECTVTEIPENRWSSVRFLDPSGQAQDRTYTRRAAVLADPFAFDAAYFGISDAEATQMDPQQRLLLETTARAFDHAGLDPDQLDRHRTGVFVGASSSDHFGYALQDPGMMNSHFMLGNTMSILSNRIAYQWDFKGPSLTVDTACSSSLFALDLARQKLAEGEIDTAIVGGVNLLLSPLPFIGFSRAQMLSKRGLCRAFAKDADGYVRAEGAIVIILQKSAVARTLGLKQRSSLVTSATNSDGRSHGMALPSSVTQAELISKVLRTSDIDPNDLAFVEAHGTGTAVGDPTEANAIGEVYGKRRGAPLPIGSAKSNFGHLEPAAGLLGFLKAQLALENNLIPATLHVDELNPNIHFGALNLCVQTENAPIPAREKPWLAAVNSFGFGGANAHAVLRQISENEEHPVSEFPPALMISAATRSSLEALAESWRSLSEEAHQDLADLVATSNRRVARHNIRLTVEAGSAERLNRSLEQWLTDGDTVSASAQTGAATSLPVVFAFPGNGTVWEGMAREIYLRDEVFRASYDEISEIFDDLGIKDLRNKLTAPDIGDDLRHAVFAQPILFAIQVALSDALENAGLSPSGTVGHSAGEVAAAVIADRITREDGAFIIATRSVAFEPLYGKGAMAALATSAEDCHALIAETNLAVDLAADNAPYSVTVSGSEEDLKQLLRGGRKRRIAGRMLEIDYPYHGRKVDVLRDRLLNDLNSISSVTSEKDFFSGWMGRDARQFDLDAEYWWNNARQVVNFKAAIESASDGRDCVFVEMTPKTVLKSYIRDTLTEIGRKPRVVETLDSSFSSERSATSIVRNVVSSSGRVDENKVLGPRNALRVSVPEYPFDRKSLVLGSDTGIDYYARRNSHTLLGAKRDPSQPVWIGSLSTARSPWLADHVIDGRVLFPATGILEVLACAVAEETGRDKALLANVFFLQAVELREEKEVATRVTIEKFSNTVMLEVSRGAGGWSMAARADVLTPFYEDQPSRFRGSMPVDLPPYDGLEAIGMSYGPSFARVSRLFCDGKQVSAMIEADLSLPEEAVRVTNADAALHGIAKLLDGRSHPMVPTFIRQAEISLESSVAQALIRRSAEDISTRFDVECYGSGNESVLRLSGLQVSAFPTPAKRKPGIWIEEYLPTPSDGPREIGEIIQRHIGNSDGAPSDADVVRSAIGGRLAWDYVASSDLSEVDNEKLEYARQYLAAMGYDAEKLGEGAECPWPELDTLIELAIQSAPKSVSVLRNALATASSTPASGEVSEREAEYLAVSVLDDLAEGDGRPFARIALMGSISRASVAAARSLGGHLTLLSLSDRELQEARVRLADEPNIAFANTADDGLRGSFDLILGVSVLGHIGVEEADRLASTLVPEGDIIFVEPALDCFSVMTDQAKPGVSLDDAAGVFRGSIEFLTPVADEQESAVAIVHGRRTVAEGEVAEHNTGNIRVIELDPAARPEETGFSIMKGLEDGGGLPVWFVRRGAGDFEELTGWRRTIRNETGIDVRVSQVDREMTDEELRTILINSNECELSIGATQIIAPRVKAHVQSDGADRRQLVINKSKSNFEGLEWQKRERVAPEAGEVEIEVGATALNFRDVMLAQGVLPVDSFEGGYSGSLLGMECAGIVVRAGPNSRYSPGARVVAIARNAFDSHVNVPDQLVVALPDDLEIEVAAALPVVFLTAEYALNDVAQLKNGDTILIHGGAGGVGLACIQLAKRIGARIFATAGSPDKRRLLKALGVAGVFDSRSLDFDRDLRSANNGVGVDVVINSLAGEALERSIGCLNPFGRFVELGKRDIVANSRIGLRALQNNVSFHAVDVDQLLVHRPELAEEIMERVSDLLQSGDLVPLPVDIFAASDAPSAFRHIQRSKHIGKTVVKAPQLAPKPPNPRLCGTWLVTGGTRGFGLETALWLVEQGVQELWLVSKSGHVAQDTLSDLERRSVTVHVRAADIARENEVAAVLDQIEAQGRGLNGVVHAAMVMDDGLMSCMDVDRVRAVMSPKVEGARHLDAHTRRFELDAFWLYSSMSARFGNPGQGAYVAANRMLEGIANRRRNEGLPGLAIAWGPIEDAGFLMRAPEVSDTLEKRLGRLMTSIEALDTLGALLADGFSHAGVSIGHFPWANLLRDVPVVTEPSFELLDLREAREEEGRIKLDKLVAELGPRKARDRILSIVQREVAGILHVTPDDVDVLRPLTEIGFDSLMILNLKLAIEEKLDVDLGVVAVGSDLSLGRIVNTLFEEQGGSDAREQLAASLAEIHFTQSKVDAENRQRILDRVASESQSHGL